MYNLLKKGYYFLIDLVTFRKGVPITISGFNLKFPPKYHRYFQKDYEQANFDFFRKHGKNCMISLDIGAHFGLFSVFLQKESQGIVYAFEPTPSTLPIIRKTIDINHCNDSIHVIPEAVDEKSGNAFFFINEIEGLSLANSLIDYNNPDAPQKGYEVKVTSIDEFVNEKKLIVDFIKIDVEGAELGVLMGGLKTITTNKPLIILSMHPKSIVKRNVTSEQIWDFLALLNYKILFDEDEIDKISFCSKKDFFDVQMIPN